MGIEYQNCPWCKGKNLPTTEHHSPVKKCDGGKKVIRICLNCHHKYHYPPMEILDLRGLPDLSAKVSKGKTLTKQEIYKAKKHKYD